MAQPTLTTTCAKCGRKLTFVLEDGETAGTVGVPFPAYCPKCDLLNALMVERYTKYERTDNG